MVALWTIVISLLLWSCNSPETENGEPAPLSETQELETGTSLDLEGGFDPPTTDLPVFQLRLEPGKAYRYRITQSSEASRDSIRILTKTVHTYTKKVVGKRRDGSFDLEMTFAETDIETTMKKALDGAVVQQISISSRDSSDRINPEYREVMLMLNEKVGVHISERGEILAIAGMKPIVDKLLKGEKDVPAEARKQLEDQLGAVMVAQFINHEHIQFPTTTLDSTLTWTNTSTTPINELFTASQKSIYRVVGIQNRNADKHARIEASLTGRVDISSAATRLPIHVKLEKAEITGSGIMLMDVNTGLTVSKNVTIETSFKARITSKESSKTETLTESSKIAYKVELLP